MALTLDITRTSIGEERHSPWLAVAPLTASMRPRSVRWLETVNLSNPPGTVSSCHPERPHSVPVNLIIRVTFSLSLALPTPLYSPLTASAATTRRGFQCVLTVLYLIETYCGRYRPSFERCLTAQKARLTLYIPPVTCNDSICSKTTRHAFLTLRSAPAFLARA